MHKVKSKSSKTKAASQAHVMVTNTAIDKEKGKAQAKAIFAKLPLPGKGIVLDIVNGGSKLPATLTKAPLTPVRFGTEEGFDIQGDIRDLSYIPSDSCDAVWNAGSLPYLYAHEVTPVLNEIYRVLKKNAVFLCSVPDMQRLGQYAYQGKFEKALYHSPAGPITTLDLMYGHAASIAHGQFERAIHTGFIASSIANKLTRAGFGDVEVKREALMLHVTARKVQAVPADKPRIRYIDEDVNKMMRARDEINKAPEIWKADISALKK